MVDRTVFLTEFACEGAHADTTLGTPLGCYSTKNILDRFGTASRWKYLEHSVSTCVKRPTL